MVRRGILEKCFAVPLRVNGSSASKTSEAPTMAIQQSTTILVAVPELSLISASLPRLTADAETICPQSLGVHNNAQSHLTIKEGVEDEPNSKTISQECSSGAFYCIHL